MTLSDYGTLQILCNNDSSDKNACGGIALHFSEKLNTYRKKEIQYEMRLLFKVDGLVELLLHQNLSFTYRVIMQKRALVIRLYYTLCFNFYPFPFLNSTKFWNKRPNVYHMNEPRTLERPYYSNIDMFIYHIICKAFIVVVKRSWRSVNSKLSMSQPSSGRKLKTMK